MDVSFMLPLLLLLMGVLLLLLSSKRQTTLHFPAGEAIYQDTQEEPGETLYSHELELKGRPDFLLRLDAMIIPIEVKTGKTPPTSPYYNHIMQLIVYCVLVEAHYGVRPSHGIIRYPEQSYEVEFTAQRESELKTILVEMRFKKQSAVDVHRNHNSPGRCASCDLRAICDQRLVTQNALPLKS